MPAQRIGEAIEAVARDSVDVLNAGGCEGFDHLVRNNVSHDLLLRSAYVGSVRNVPSPYFSDHPDRRRQISRIQSSTLAGEVLADFCCFEAPATSMTRGA